MGTPANIPQLEFVVDRAAEGVEPLRSDVLGVIGRCRRGPVARLIRIVGWQEYLATFGPIEGASLTSFALRGYFANGGEVAHVYRLRRPDIGAR
ncbi:MAG: phage tail protein, partial [Deltaproteobacteria bacterium]|nr:phage tail protein [Deltaproteobacteria bacterium]